MKKHIINNKLAKKSSIRSSNVENKKNHRGFHSRIEGIMVVNTVPLIKVFESNKLCNL